MNNTPLAEFQGLVLRESAPAAGALRSAEDDEAQALWIAVRPGYLVALFLACWAVNVSVFARFRVDYFAVLGLAKDELVSPQRLCASALLIGVVLGFFRIFTLRHVPTLFIVVAVLLTYLAALLALFSWLPPALARHSRWRVPLARALWRCLWPDQGKEVPFVEVLVADGLTSISRAFFDVALASCVAARSLNPFESISSAGSPLSGSPLSGHFSEIGALREGGPLHEPGSQRLLLAGALEQCQRSPLPFLAWAVPFLIRARQCMVTVRNAPDSLSRGLQRVNFLKYLSALPIVAFAFCHASAGGLRAPALSQEDFEVLWALAAVLNATFSFTWDLVMDWGLMQPAPCRTGQLGLRPVLLFRGVWGFYHGAIICNLFGRTLWSLRWSPQITLFLGGFFLSSLQQAAEVLRRGLWNVLRVEWECIRKGVHRSDKHFPV